MYQSTKTYGHDTGLSCCFRQWRANSHCSLTHGYALKIELTFESKTLDDRNWVMDFGGLKSIKEWLKFMFDHTTLVAKDDPHVKWYEQGEKLGILDIRIVNATGCEATAKLIWEWVSAWLAKRNAITLRSVQVWEHEGNSAKYINPN